MSTIEELERIAHVLRTSPLPCRSAAWGGAGVVIEAVSSEPRVKDGFYSEPRYVVTPHALELSWMFEGLYRAFIVNGRLDHCSKYEFFGRLANAANRCLGSDPEVGARMLCAAVVQEAFSIYEDQEAGAFDDLSFAGGGEVLDDRVHDAARSGFRSPEGAVAFFKERGIALGAE